jgi:triosephosphate isomerase
MRKQIAAANWKMNLTYQQGSALLQTLVSSDISLNEHQAAVFAVPYPYLAMAVDAIHGKNNYFIAAQNCSNKKSGAYTGEVSAEMLKSLNLKYCIVGHSERREYYGESNQILTEKLNLCLANNITPIFCCGEALPVREQNQQNSFVEQQLKDSLFHLSKEEMMKIVIAYEPIWAIGTGKTASTIQAQEMHAYIRSVLNSQYGDTVAEQISILYGGSVKANNAHEIFNSKDVDGGLVGGASLIASEFIEIIKALK